MVVNDRAFRRKFTGCKGDYDISKCRRIVHPKGTLYVPISDDEGHFMAYEFVGSGVIRVFDPAHPKSRYSGHVDRAHISKIIRTPSRGVQGPPSIARRGYVLCNVDTRVASARHASPHS